MLAAAASAPAGADACVTAAVGEGISTATDGANALHLEADKGSNEASEALADGRLLFAGLQAVSGADLRPVCCVVMVEDRKHSSLVTLDGA